MNVDLSTEDGHLCNMGRMIEEIEGKLRNSLDQVNFYPFFVVIFYLFFVLMYLPIWFCWGTTNQPLLIR